MTLSIIYTLTLSYSRKDKNPMENHEAFVKKERVARQNVYLKGFGCSYLFYSAASVISITFVTYSGIASPSASYFALSTSAVSYTQFTMGLP